MSATLAILTIGVVPINAVLPLLTEHIAEDQITHVSLMGHMDPADALEDYAAEPGDDEIRALLNNGEVVKVSRQKVQRDLQSVIEVLDNQGYDVILLMFNDKIAGLKARNTILLEPQRIIPPLVASIVDGHQVGVLVPMVELLGEQQQKWQALSSEPLYAIANPQDTIGPQLVEAGKSLIDQGADVLMLDCLGFHQAHRDHLQKTLDVPVLLSNVLVARLASELLM
ncbi:AroM family protein [Enterobacter sp. ENT03]|uniref:AroM family protein n=1 Tax=Enterobacter sp. ENT03 TaxID=2854780 RepID=UPI001C469470|nr:AroM family protein [Enterobacter sp. ENT03]MBV7405313.1 AroM family protein [Enterobacter sp. ENT03]